MSVDMRAYVGGVGVAVVCSTHGTSPPPSPSSSLLPLACITQLGAIVSQIYLSMSQHATGSTTGFLVASDRQNPFGSFIHIVKYSST